MGVLACVEVGGSGTQTVVFAGDEAPRFVAGVATADADAVALAIPGIISGRRVVAASNLRWFDVDPAEQLGITAPIVAVVNDAEAAALGEAAIRRVDDVTFVTLGTGVGGAVVIDGTIVAGNLFGHARGYSDRRCACGEVGCLETVAAGWALPRPLGEDARRDAAKAVAHAIETEPAATPDLVVVGGGMARDHPALVEAIARALPQRRVEATGAPPEAKSAAAWGLRALVDRRGVAGD